MEASLEDKSRFELRIKEIIRTSLVVALVCMIMPFVEVTANGATQVFSIYDMIATFYKSEVGLYFTFEAKALLNIIRTFAMVIILSIVFGLIMLSNPNRKSKESDNNTIVIVASFIAMALILGYYYYLRYVITAEVQNDAVITLKVGGISALVCLGLNGIILITRKIKKRTVMAALVIIILIPATIAFGIIFLNDRKYYVISMLIIFETMLPFFMIFENRKPEARELIIIAVMAAIGVAGRAAFFMVPQFKPVLAIVIITGVCLGAEAGFLTGALTAFVSNFFFGQGPWTPWQMFAFGIVGFLAAILFQRGVLKRKLLPLCIFGFLSALLIYGPIVDTCSIFTMAVGTKTAAYTFYLTGLPFNIIHGVATVIFLALLAKPMIEKLERIKKKYGLMEAEK
ncbi:MAG: ECF transporter S component [Bacillota bacterium]|nr:ECF transporter S component [Bacillota bacterium]